MSTQSEDRFSQEQKRYLQLTRECGLDFDEAMYALGRRSGGLPEYRKLSRLEQFNKIQQLIGAGATRDEAERVVGVFRERGPSTQKRRKLLASDSCSKEPFIRCYRCRTTNSSLV